MTLFGVKYEVHMIDEYIFLVWQENETIFKRIKGRQVNVAWKNYTWTDYSVSIFGMAIAVRSLERSEALELFIDKISINKIVSFISIVTFVLRKLFLTLSVLICLLLLICKGRNISWSEYKIIAFTLLCQVCCGWQEASSAGFLELHEVWHTFNAPHFSCAPASSHHGNSP